MARQKEETERNIGHLNKFGAAAQQAAEVFENQNASMAELSIATKAMDKAMLEGKRIDLSEGIDGLREIAKKMKEQIIWKRIPDTNLYTRNGKGRFPHSYTIPVSQTLLRKIDD